MSIELAKLVVALEAQTAQFNKAIVTAMSGVEKMQARTNKALNKIQRQFSTFGSTMKGLAVGYLGAQLFRSIVKHTADADAAVAQLNATLKSTGGVVGYSSQELQDYASELQRVTTYGDEATVQMMSLLATFTNIRGPTFKQATEAVMDIATKMGTDLKSAAVQVGKALQDPIKGVTALTRVGVNFNDAQKETIKRLVETGRAAEAQQMILKELNVEFGGSARAARDTFGGALAGLQNAFGDLLEVKSGVPGATAALNEFTDVLSDPGTKAAADALFGGIITAVTKAATFVARLAGGVKTLAENLAAVRYGAAAGDAVRIDKDIAIVQRMMKLGQRDPRRMRFIGKGGIVEWWSDDELKAELARLQGMYADALDGMKPPPVPVPTTGGGGGAAPVLEDEEGTGKKARGSSAASAAEQATEAIQQQITALRQQIETMGASEAATLAYRTTLGDLAEKFAAMGPAGEPMRLELIALALQLEEQERATEEAAAATAEHTKMQEEAAAVVEGLKDDYARASDEVERYYELHRAGLLTEEQLAAAIGKVSTALAESVNKTEEATGQMTVFWDQAMRNMQDVLADALFNSFEDGVDGMVLAWAQALKRMAAEALAANIFGAITAGAKGAGGWLSGIFGAIFGGVTVGGGMASINGLDMGLVGLADGGLLRANRWQLVGEEGPELVMPRSTGMVLPADTTAALLRGTRDRDDMNGRAVNVVMNIQTPDADSFRRTETQIQARLQSALNRASMRKN